MSSQPTSARSLPVYGIHDVVYFNLAPNGAFRVVRGPGIERTGRSEAEWVGFSVSRLYEANPELRAVYQALLAGHPVRTVVRYGGEPWFMDAAPVFEGGVQIGASGFVQPLTPEGRPPPVEESEPEPREWIWELSGEPEGEPGYWSADRFLRVEGEPGAMLTRYIPDGELIRLLSDHPSRMHLIYDSGPPAPPSSRRLRLLP